MEQANELKKWELPSVRNKNASNNILYNMKIGNATGYKKYASLILL